MVNGIELNGMSITGLQLSGATIHGIAAPATPLLGMHLVGTMLSGTILDSPMCGHSEGVAGAALPSSCNACAGIVCSADAHCCGTSWDATCVGEAQSMCAVKADALGNNGRLQATLLVGASSVSATLKINAVRQPEYWVEVGQKCTKATRWSEPNCTPIYQNEPGAGPNADVYIYDVSYSLDSGQSWQNLCSNVDADGFTNSAIPVAGAWQPGAGQFSTTVNQQPTTYFGGGVIPGSQRSAIAFGCRNFGATAKCVEFGYKPWSAGAAYDANGSGHTASLTDVHQACVRMLRADYCGDGYSYTQNNTAIDFADAYSIQSLDPTDRKGQLDYGPEGEWTSQGALCLNTLRYSTLAFGASDHIGRVCPVVNPFWQAVGSACVQSWGPYNSGNGFSEPSFVVNPATGRSEALLIDFTSTMTP